MRAALIFLLMVATACSTPRESCLRSATAELQRVDRLIQETEANLARGYSIEQVPRTVPRLDLCVGTGRRTYNTGFGVSYCRTNDTLVTPEPRAIDPAAERRKLDQLRTTRARVERQAATQIAACPAAT
ncbi:MAG: hypothetical protein AAFU80_18300 [Pseudomonadota bacterium]